MKSYLLIVIFSFLSFTTKGQELKCCESVNDVKQYLSGKWKVQNSDAKITYEYSFDEAGVGRLSEIENLMYVVIEDDYSIDITKDTNGFRLKYTYLLGSYMSELKYLNSKRMILITEGKQVEYVKVSN